MSWYLGKVSDIADIISGYAFKTDCFGTGNDKIIKIGNLQNGRITNNDLMSFDSNIYKVSEQFKIQTGDILMALSGATVGKIAIAQEKDSGSYLNQRVAIVRGNSPENAQYLKYVFSGHLLEKLLLFAGGAAQPNLSPKSLADMEIPLPPLDEQKRIAAILDKADSLRRKRQQAIQLADEFLRAVFLDLFGDPVTNPKGWKKEPLSNHFKIGTGGTPSRANPDNYGGDISWVKTTEVCGEVILKTSETISQKGLSDSNCTIYPKNSIIIAMYGQGKTRGQCGVLGIDAATNQACAILEPSETLEMNFVYQYIKYSYQQLRELSRGGNQQNLNLSLVKSFEIIIPDRKLQIYFSDIYLKVQKILKVSDDFKKDDLFNSLSQKAFAGEL